MGTMHLLNEIIEQADQMVKKMAKLSAENQHLNETLKECRLEVSQTLELLRHKEEEGLQKQALIEKLQHNLHEYELLINQLKGEKNDLKQQTEVLQKDIASLKSTHEKLHADYEMLRKEFNLLQTQIKSSMDKPPRKSAGRSGKKPKSSD